MFVVICAMAVEATATVAAADVVTISYDDLCEAPIGSLHDMIERAYGHSGLGILVVSGIPQLKSLRRRTLESIREFACLPAHLHAQFESAESFYSVGWSHGREKMAKDVYDTAKGSFYFNPIADDAFADQPELKEAYPAFCAPNMWPSELVPSMQPNAMRLSRLLVDTGALIASHCDAFVESRCASYERGKLQRIVRESRTCKARLLHYFPQQQPSDWCGWHNDHGSLTGLVRAMYFDADGREVDNPDPSAGLYVQSRCGGHVKVAIPGEDCAAFQIGETAQIHSGGVLKATPHFVRGISNGRGSGVSRDTLACFMQPTMPERMNLPDQVDVQHALHSATPPPPTVPLLSTRWNADQDFAQFTSHTLAAYYN